MYDAFDFIHDRKYMKKFLQAPILKLKRDEIGMYYVEVSDGHKIYLDELSSCNTINPVSVEPEIKPVELTEISLLF